MGQIVWAWHCYDLRWFVERSLHFSPRHASHCSAPTPPRAAFTPSSFQFAGASPAGSGTGTQQQAGAVTPGGTAASSNIAGTGGLGACIEGGSGWGWAAGGRGDSRGRRHCILNPSLARVGPSVTELLHALPLSPGFIQPSVPHRPLPTP